MYMNSPLNNTYSSPSKKLGSPSSLKSNLLLSRSTTTDTTITSPYNARVKSLEKRFNDLPEKAKSVVIVPKKNEELEDKIRSIDEKVVKNHLYTDEKFKLAESDMKKTEELLISERTAHESLHDAMNKEMTAVESHIAHEMKEQYTVDKKAQIEVIENVNSMVAAARAECYETQEKINSFVAKNNNEISEKIYNLRQGLRTEKKNREAEHGNAISTVSEKLKKMKDTMNTEKQVTRETENYLMRKIEELNSVLRSQVEKEKQERERNQEQMFKLLETACTKFENQIREANRRY